MTSLNFRRLRVLAMAQDKQDSFKNWLKFMLAVVSSQAEFNVPDKKIVDKWFEKGRDFASDYNEKRYNLLRKYLYDHNDRYESYVNNMGMEIKDKILPAIQADDEISSDLLDLTNTIGGYFRNLSESPLNGIMKKSSILGDSNIGRAFTYDIEMSQDAAIKKAIKLASKILGKPVTEPRIDAAIKKKLKKKYAKNEKMLELIKEQTKAYTSINNIYKQHLANIVRASGKKYLPIEQVRSALKKKGVKKIGLPEGFVGMVDDNGSLYTIKGLKMAGCASGYPVEMNPEYDPDKDNTFVCSCDGNGTFAGSQRYYTENYKMKGRTHKYKLVEEADENIDEVREKWLKNLHRWTGDKKNVAALELEIVYNLATRIGSPAGKTDGKPTYGTSTWMKKHIHIDPSGKKALISYIGKKGQPQKHRLNAIEHPEHQLIIDRLKKLTKDKGPRDYVFTDNNGTRVGSSVVNAELKGYGSPATIHKLRHIKGSRLAKKVLAKSPFDNRKTPPKQSEVDKWVKKQIEKVGKQLGHQVTKADGTKKTQWSTSMQSYIRADIVKDFYKRINVHIPKFLEKLKTED